MDANTLDLIAVIMGVVGGLATVVGVLLVVYQIRAKNRATPDRSVRRAYSRAMARTASVIGEKNWAFRRTRAVRWRWFADPGLYRHLRLSERRTWLLLRSVFDDSRLDVRRTVNSLRDEEIETFRAVLTACIAQPDAGLVNAVVNEFYGTLARELYAVPNEAGAPILVRHAEAIERRLKEHQAQTAPAALDDANVVGTYRTYIRHEFGHIDSPAFGRLSFHDSPTAAEIWVRPSRRYSGRDPRTVRARTLLDLVVAGAAEQRTEGTRWLLLGEPGAGKTTELRRLTFELAAHRTLVPVFFSLPKLVEGAVGSQPIVESELERLHWSRDKKARLVEALERAGQIGDLVLLFDGLDEVPEELRDRCETLIQTTLADLRRPTAVVSARLLRSEPLGGFDDIELRPFDAPQQRQLVAALLGVADVDVRARAIADELSQSAVRAFAGNPLYITLFVTLVRDGGRPAATPLDLHLQFVDLLLSGAHRRVRRSVANPTLARTILSQVALHMVDGGKVQLTHHEMCEWLDAHAHAEVASAWTGAAAFMEDVASVSNILAGAHRKGSLWRFWHRAMRDALAAQALLEDLRRRGAGRRQKAAERLEESRVLREDPPQWAKDDYAASEWTLLETQAASVRIEDHWAEVYALLVAQAPNPDDVLTSLATVSRPLALRALASAPALKDSTYSAILQLSPTTQERRRNWPACRAVIEQLEQTIEPERALELIDKIRAQVRDGNNLYFISRAYDRIAAAHAHLDERVSHLKARLFEHLHKPLDAWFADVPGHAGRRFLTRVDAGEQLVAHGEGKSRVGYALEIAHPFMLSSVSVTNEMFGRFAEGRPPGRNAYAATTLTWYEAVSFCEWLSQLEAFAGARLPFEAEWEFACLRGGCDAPDDADPAIEARDVISLAPVGQHACDRIGAFDMIGHAECWCADDWSAWDGVQPIRHDPRAAAFTHAHVPRVLRGGFGPSAGRRRAWDRDSREPGSTSETIGFRIVVPTVTE